MPIFRTIRGLSKGRRFQWRPNRDGGQTVGNRQVVTPIDEEIYNRFIKDATQEDMSWSDYRKSYPGVTHASITEINGTQKLSGVGSQAELVPQKEAWDRDWVHEVPVFDDADEYYRAADFAPHKTAEEIAKKLEEKGFSVGNQITGPGGVSKSSTSFGQSSYIPVSLPGLVTAPDGRKYRFNREIRVSDHGTGSTRSPDYIHVQSESDVDDAINQVVQEAKDRGFSLPGSKSAVTAGLLGAAAMQPEEAEAGPIAAGARRILAPRFSHPIGGGATRKGLIDTIETMGAEVTPRNLDTGDTFRLSDFEGQPYLISQSDRSAAGGTLDSLYGQQIDPVDLRGGRDFMFENPGMVWASDPNVVDNLLKRAARLKEDYKQDPLLLPYTMAPTGIDFATMPLDTMINFARANMSKTNIKKLDRQIKKILPDWGGVADPNSNALFRTSTGDQRKRVVDVIDKKFRDVKGGLSIAEARAATTDAAQYYSDDGSMVNIGRIFASDQAIADSGHPTYLGGLPGEGVGTFETPLNLRPFIERQGRVLANDPSDIRAASLNPALTQGVVDEKLLRQVEGSADPKLLAGLAAGSGASALTPTISEKAQGVLDAILNIGQAAVAPLSNAPHTLIQALTSDRPTAQVRAGQQQRLDAMDYQPGELGQQYTDDFARFVADQINQSRILNALGQSRILQTPINAIQQLPDRARLVGGSILDALLL